MPVRPLAIMLVSVATAIAPPSLLSATPLFVTLVPSAAAQSVDPVDAAIRHLQKATTFRQDGLHHAILRSLRDLRDPTLQPLFQRLVQADHWTIQMDAILGLAELSAPAGEPGTIDPWLIGQLRREQDRTDAARLVVELRMAGPEQIRTMLKWDHLSSVAQLVLLADLNRQGETPPREALERLADHSDPPIAGFAACLLALQGDATRLEAFRATLNALPRRDRDHAIDEIATAGTLHRVPPVIDLLESHVADPQCTVREAIVAAALALEPERGARLWPALVAGPNVTQGTRVRAGLLLLAAAPTVPPQAFDALRDPTGSDDGLLDAMGKAGRAVAGSGDRIAALIALYDTGHRRCRHWILRTLSQLDSTTIRAVALHIINGLDERSERTPDRATEAAEAVRILMEVDPEAVIELVGASQGAKLEAILIGLANSRSPRAAEAAARVPRIGAGRTDSLALVVIARGAERLERADLRQLGLIAAGGGRVDPTLQAQAAWLYLRHAGRLEHALPRIMPTE